MGASVVQSPCSAMVDPDVMYMQVVAAFVTEASDTAWSDAIISVFISEALPRYKNLDTRMSYLSHYTRCTGIFLL